MAKLSGQISDMNVQATESQILPLRGNAGKLRGHFTHGRQNIDDAQLVGCDKQCAGTPNHRHGVPALALVTPYKFTNWAALEIPQQTQDLRERTPLRYSVGFM